MNDENLADTSSPSPPGKPKRITIRPVTIYLFLIVTILVMMILGWPYLQARYNLPWFLRISLFPVPTSSNDPQPLQYSSTPTRTPTPSATLPFYKADQGLWSQGIIVLSIQEGLDSHLFVYRPIVGQEGKSLPLTRLTSGSWHDVTPCLSPKSDRLAFASDRNGFWNIYLLDLPGGEVAQITNSPDYIGSPSWSPDGLWIAYEAYIDDNLDIFLQQVDGDQDSIRLTNHPEADSEPAWAPNGRQIAFVSTRSGSKQVWLANLDDSSSSRFLILSDVYERSAAHPTWSPDGRYLVWSAVTTEGLHKIYLWDSQTADSPAVDISTGDWATWSPAGNALLVNFNTPFDNYLTAYSVEKDRSILLPPLKLPGQVNGLLWADVTLSGDLVQLSNPTPTLLWQDNLQVSSGFEDRWDLVELQDVEAPYPYLHDRVDESFQAFRMKLASLTGWDLLLDLENAYIPFSSALSPGLLKDWLYTGRAFAFNTLPIKAGWMVVIREDYGQETYWRVYLRTRFQDGSQGRPLNELPWDFNARYSGDPKSYEQGGDYAVIVPAGYWVDFTRVAAAYGWQRFPALSTWRVAYPSTRFNEFAFTEGLTWESAILEVYPPEILLTLTPLPTTFATATAVPVWFPTSTLTSTPSLAATRTIVVSPSPTATRTVTTAVQGTPSLTIEPSFIPSPTGTKTATP